MPEVRQVVSPDGTGIVYRAWGAPGNPPLVLLHGWAQSSGCWSDAVVLPLARRFRVVAVDLRGHGYSDAPPDGYDDPARWAGDTAAVLGAEGVSERRKAVLVGWSYGGLAACHYLDHAGEGDVAGLVLVGAITGIGRGARGGQVGASMRDALPAAVSEVPREAIRALGGMRMTAAPLGGEAQQRLFGASLCTPPHVRAGLFRRTADSDLLLAQLQLPVLLVHGTNDTVVDVASSEHAAALLGNARLSLWDGVGHCPFLEDSARFVAEVGDFARGALA